MIIDQLPELSIVLSTDELPIERGQTTYKATVENLARSAISSSAIFHKNMLRNWYFVGGGSQKKDGTFPINSLGAIDYEASGYLDIIDSWAAIGQVGFGIRSDYCIFAALYSTTGYVQQVIKNLPSGKITISALTYEGDLYTVTGDTSESFASNGSSGVGFNSNSKAAFIFTDSVLNIVAVKVELGFSQTLAYQDDGIWVLNDIPDYEVELIKDSDLVPKTLNEHITYRKFGNICLVRFSPSNELETGEVDQWLPIGTMPEKYRPVERTVALLGAGNYNGSYIVSSKIETNGEISICCTQKDHVKQIAGNIIYFTS